MICIGTKYETEALALADCPGYCHVEYCDICKAWHVIQGN
jgi:hypothetical protein